MAECGKSMSAWSSGRWSQRVVSISTPAAVVIKNNMKKHRHVRINNTDVMQLIALVALRSLSPPRPVLGREILIRSRHLGDATLAQMMLVSEMLRCCT
jgi:hypothetical protein